MSNKIYLDGNNLSIEQVYDVMMNKTSVAIHEDAKIKVIESRKRVQDILDSAHVVYGINTGFGKFKDVVIENDKIDDMQINFMLSHACGVGEPFAREIVRGIILLRANALIKGYSGVRVEVIQFLLDLLENDICPLIPSQGSVGSSGDLAPLAHLGLTVIGRGQILEADGTICETQIVLARHKLKPLILHAKEALALTNGTQAMTSNACYVVENFRRLLKLADIIGAMSLEAMLGSIKAFDEDIHLIRPHLGQIASAKNIRQLLTKSDFIESHKNCPMVQDAYSLRCMPQVHGASRQAFEHIKEIVSIEINSSTDNPLIFEDKVLSGGNFHGQPIALVMDYASIALAELANISERRIERLVNPALSNGLPPFLTVRGGLNSGFMIAQYTAASLVSENKSLAHPASVDSIPTSANQEDHVSMGTIASRKALNIINNLYNVLAIELLCACQGIDFRVGLKGNYGDAISQASSLTQGQSAGLGVMAAYRYVREHIPVLIDDRIISYDIAQANKILKSLQFINCVESACGVLE